MGPSDSSKAFFFLFGFKPIKPHMRVDIDYSVRKEGLQALPVEIPVNSLDFK